MFINEIVIKTHEHVMFINENVSKTHEHVMLINKNFGGYSLPYFSA